MLITYHFSVYFASILTKSTFSCISSSFHSSSKTNSLLIDVYVLLSCATSYNTIHENVNYEKCPLHIWIIYVRNSYNTNSPQNILNNIHLFHAASQYAIVKFSCCYIHFHNHHTYTSLHQNNVSCDIHNSSEN